MEEPNTTKKKGPNPRNIVLYVLLGLVLVALVGSQLLNFGPQQEIDELITSDFVTAVNEDRVAEVTYHAASATLDGTYYKDAAAKEAGELSSFKSTYTGDDMLQELMAAHPETKYNEDVTTSGWITTLLTTLLPLLLIFGVLIFFMSQVSGANSKQMQFGKTKAKKVSEETPKVRFSDVAGIDEAVEELEEIKDFLSNPAKYQAMGAKIPRGVLLVGPPGTGKTLLARAVAGEAGVPFFSISGSDFVEMFVGVGASRVRDLFAQAKESAPAIIFIDEIDAVGRQRGAGLGGGHDEREQTLNQLLVEMDGFESNDSVIMIAATNRVDILDPALLRPGRFDRQIVVDRPDLKGREQILKVHCEGKPMASDVDLAALASLTSGFTGADLANLLNEAALLAARRGKSIITNDEVTESMERVVAGPERKGRIMTEKEKTTIAYHESGHALVGHLLNHTDPIHKISIIARGQALGYTLSIPSEDRFLQSKSEMIDNLAMFLGGRVAEEIMNDGDVTTGASNDLERATKMAKAMVTRYGMSDILGHQVYGEPNQEVFLGRDFGSTPDYSQETANTIDEEVARLMTTAHDTAFRILSENRTQLELMANVLLERETVEGKAVEALLDNSWDEYIEWEKTHPKEAEEDRKDILTAAENAGVPHELMGPEDVADMPAPVSPPPPDSDEEER
ncbi:MAG TPA: ATP-dependent zinc metalloprotease FtsH [Coriobacteriaceae bacterium]|nr:ATP-dependent zinc metalloprotease FtsH [Coriobacteriaceae bacterium]